MSGAWLAERLNTEPPVSRGCSVVEILAILGGAVGLWLPLGGVIGGWQRAFQLGLAGGVVAIVLTMAIAPSVLQRMKRDRPHGYYQHWFAVRLQDRGLLPRAYPQSPGGLPDPEVPRRSRGRSRMAGEARGAARPHPTARAAPRTGLRAETLEPLGAGRRRAWVDFAIDETVKGMPVKQTLLRYPLEVVRMEVAPSTTPGVSPSMATGRRSQCGSAKTRGSRRSTAPRLDLNLPRTAEKDDARS
jgi:conjugative transfer region protein (TIGR03750 family)